MSKKYDKNLKHVISFRVTDLEKEALEEISAQYGIKCSSLLRSFLALVGRNVDDLGIRPSI